ncbi:MAG: PQQ-binding-like beta-propeller repeat protein [Phototrophicaceae bacterium]
MPETTQFGGFQDDSPLDSALQVNTILLARYKIEGQLGGGGQGAVYQARDLNFPDSRRLVAIKEMHVTTNDNNLRASTMKTFQREANILATLNHPAIPKIYDFFEKNDRAYLVMEYINGRDLEAILSRTKTLPINKIIEWGIDLCDVLQYLHNHQPEAIIFRDMKPANIMIDSLGKVRLIDFGIAKVFVSGLPQTMIGTEGYSAPEQYKGKANPLSDIYSLGATMHHVISRADPRLEPPFSFTERPLTSFNEDASPELENIVMRSLEFDPDKRFQSCADMKDALEMLKYRPAQLEVNNTATMANGDGSEKSTEFFGKRDASDLAGIRPVWTFATEDEIRSSPIAFGDKVYIGSYDTNVWALDIETGKLGWKKATEGGIAVTPAIDSEYKQILFGSEDYTFNSWGYGDARLNWTYTTSDKIRSSATVAHGHVFFGSDDGKLYALIAHNGRFMWDYPTEAPIRSKPCVTNDRVIFGNEAGDIIALELNGTKKWSVNAKRAVTSSPIVDNENFVYVGSFDGFLYALDGDNGFTQWRYRTGAPIISTPALGRGFVYFGSADGKLYCVNTATGKERWNFKTEKPIVASPYLHGDIVYFGGTDNKFYAIDARNGKELWHYEAGGEITSTPIIVDDLIIFGCLDRKVYALPLINMNLD